MNNFGIYIHIPFCESKCKYCSFVSGCYNNTLQTQYFFALKNEIQNTKITSKITSIYFGGGTPSCVNEKYICDVLTLLFNQYKVSKNAEITIECNPNSVSLTKLKEYKKSGFNRISFGAQSFDDDALKKLGRIHTSQDIFNAVNLAKSAGFNNISIDLILGVSAVDYVKFENNIDKLGKSLTHISAYMLMLEDNTVLKNEVKNGIVKVLSDDESVLQYENIKKIFKKYGFCRYEVSNFAKMGYESKHNKNYWNVGQYYGFGLNSHSYVNGKRFCNTSNFNEYLQIDFVNNSAVVNTEILTNQQKIEEYIMLALRTKYGIKISELLNFGYDILTKKSREIAELQKIKAISVSKNTIKITPKFFGVMNQIIVKLI